MFDVNSQSIVWKKQMAACDGGYRLRHIGRNLVIYSDDRVAMVNSVGHVIFEVPLLGDTASALELFQEKNGDIFIVMVRDRLVTVYNGYVSAGSFLIQDTTSSEGSVFKPLEVIYNSAFGSIVLLAQVGQSESHVDIAAFAIDHKSYESTFIGQLRVDPFTSISRTKTNVILHR